jgi:hypothetical protein
LFNIALVPVGFNSDNLVPDEDEETLNPFFDVGKKTTEEMLQFAMVDRLSSNEEAGKEPP